MNHNLTLNSRNLNSHHTKVPKIQDTFIKHMMYQTIEKPRHTKFIYDPDIPKEIHPNFRIKSSKLGISFTVQCLFQQDIPHLKKSNGLSIYIQFSCNFTKPLL